MRMAGVRQRCTGKKLSFQITRCPKHEKSALVSKIRSLGGFFLDGESFDLEACTHVICVKPCRSEKFLGACASGKWILKPSFVDDSYQKHRWLEEEEYEWSRNMSSNTGDLLSQQLSQASSKWRRQIQDGGLPPFVGWKAAVLVNQRKIANVYKRLVISGGGKVTDLSVPIDNAPVVARDVNHVFVEPSLADEVHGLLEIGVLCLDPVYIGDFLTMEHCPDPRAYLVINQSRRPVPSLLKEKDHTYSRQQSAQSITKNSLNSLNEKKTNLPCKTEEHVVSNSQIASQRLQKQSQSPARRGRNTSKPATPSMKITNFFKKIPASPKSDKKENIGVMKSSQELLRASPTLSASQETSSGLSYSQTSTPPVSQKISPASKNVSAGFQGDRVSVSDWMKMRKGSDDADGSEDGDITEVFSSTPPNSITPTQCVTPEFVDKFKAKVKTLCQQSLISEIVNTQQTVSKPSSPAAERMVASSTACVSSAQRAPGRTSLRRIRDVMVEKESRRNSSASEKEMSAVNMKPKVKLVRLTPEVISRAVRASKSHSAIDTPSTQPVKRFFNTASPGMASCSQSSSSQKLTRSGSLPTLRRLRDMMAVKESDAEKSSVSPDKADVKEARVALVRLSSKHISKALKKPSVPSTDVLEEHDDTDGSDIHWPDSAESKKEESQTKAVNHTSAEVAADSSQLDARSSQETGTEKTLPTNSRKRKLSTNEADGHCFSSPMKRQRVLTVLWRTLAFKQNSGYTERKKPTQPVSENVVIIFRSSVEEKQYGIALHYINTSLSPALYPTVTVLHTIIASVLLGADSEHTGFTAYSLLHRIRALHPASSPNMARIYLESLRYDITTEPRPSDAWQFITSLIRSVIDGKTDSALSERQVNNRLLLIKFIISLIESDYRNYLSKEQTESKSSKRCLLYDILWPSLRVPHLNKNCQELAALMATACMEGKDKLLEYLQHLVAMVAESLRGMNKRGRCVPGDALSDNTHLFIKEIAYHTAQVEAASRLQLIFLSFQLPWLALAVAKTLLDSYDDSVLPPNFQEPQRLSLTTILKRYLYLIPPALTGQSKPNSCHSSPQKKVTRGNNVGVPETARTPKMSPRKKNVNRRNARGETPLLVACMKNKAEKVAELLKMPGIDVNMKDFAGWTPLHEAANHGSVECIELLLNYRPVKSTITSYFLSEGTCHVDIDMVAGEGITPLHDAVMHNQYEAAAILLRYGGPRLLETKTNDGYTALTLATDDKMRQVLQSSSSQLDRSLSPCISMSESFTLSSPTKKCYTKLSSCVDVEKCLQACSCYCVLVFFLMKNYLSETCLSSTETSSQSCDETDTKCFKSIDIFISSWEKHLCQISGKQTVPLMKFINPVKLLAQCCSDVMR